MLVAYGPRTLHFAGVELDFRGRLQAGLLDLGPGALVSGESTGALMGLDGYDEGPLQFLVPRAHRRRAAIGEVVSTRVLGPLDRCVVDGLACTSGTRTIIELLGRVSEQRVGNAIDSATRLGRTTPSVVRRRLAEMGRQGRAGVEQFERVMECEGVQSWVERQFLRLVIGAGFPRPSTQRVYRRDGKHVARIDFDFEPAPALVEVGGRRGYMSADERRRQEHRRNDVQLMGKTIYFFTTEDVVETPSYVVATLRAALTRAA